MAEADLKFIILERLLNINLFYELFWFEVQGNENKYLMGILFAKPVKSKCH